MAGCGAFTADASRCASRQLSTPHAGPCAALPPSCRACDADLVRGGGASLRAVSAARLFYGCAGASTEGSAAERARVAEILAPDVALYRDAQRLWQTYKDAFGGGNATVPEGAAGRRAGRRSERRAAQQMLRQRRRVVGEG